MNNKDVYINNNYKLIQIFNNYIYKKTIFITNKEKYIKLFFIQII